MSTEGLINGIAILVYVASVVGSVLLGIHRGLVWGVLAALGSVAVLMMLTAWAAAA